MVYTIYAQKENMTFIMEDNEGNVSCRGFYPGSPNSEFTQKYTNSYTIRKKKNIVKLFGIFILSMNKIY